MAFTIEEIDQALFPAGHATNASRNSNIKESVNYKIITRFLTGQATSLQGLLQDATIYELTNILQLLKSIDPVTENDQLVLDIIHDPGLSQSLQYFFNHRLMVFALQSKTDAAFNAVTGQFRLRGFNDAQIAAFFLYAPIHFEGNVFPDIPLKSFLLNYIKIHGISLQSSPASMHQYNQWSFTYFFLLEETRPELAGDYMLQAMGDYSKVTFFISYKDGAYISGIIQYIQEEDIIHIHSFQSRLYAAILLWESDETKYSILACDTCIRYLNYLKAGHYDTKWESRVRLQEFEKTPQSFIEYSSAAFYLLSKLRAAAVGDILNGWFDSKMAVPASALTIMQRQTGAAAFPFLSRAVSIVTSNAEYVSTVVNLIVANYALKDYQQLIWNLAKSKSKAVRELIARMLSEKDADAETKAIGLLQNKNAETRQTAAIILGYFTSAAAKDAVMKILHTEANDNARDILLQTISTSLPTAASMDFIGDMVAAAKSRGKLNKPIEAWLNETILPPLFYSSGKQLAADEIRFLLYRMSRMKEMHSDMEANYILQFTDKARSSGFAIAIIKLYIDNGAKPEHKYLMALAALLGNDAVVDKIRTTINRWIEENRYKMAEHGVGALALHGSDKALRWVEWYSRKYKSKKANVGAAALLALETAAEELGITSHELGDRIVPDFGFDGLFKNFTAGGEEYRGFIDSNFKLAFFNEDNKKVKAIPATADTAIKDEFKAIAKEVRDIVKSQSPRLEYYLIIQRRWTIAQWHQFFLQNPVMFIYATRILWGVFDAAGKLLQTFICSEDTSLLNQENEEILLEENGSIGIVHPSQLNEDLLQIWKKQFYDLSIESIFPQLERRIPDMKDVDLSKAILTKFEGKEMVTGSVRSTLEKYGWHKGPTGDGGMLESFNLLYFEKKIEAILEVSGIGAGYGWGGEEKLGRFFIIDKSKNAGRWFISPKNNDDDRIVKLKDTPTIFLSEALAAIETIKKVVKEPGTA